MFLSRSEEVDSDTDMLGFDGELREPMSRTASHQQRIPRVPSTAQSHGVPESSGPIRTVTDNGTAQSPQKTTTGLEGASIVPSNQAYSPYLKDATKRVDKFNIRYFKKPKPISFYRQQARLASNTSPSSGPKSTGENDKEVVVGFSTKDLIGRKAGELVIERGEEVESVPKPHVKGKAKVRDGGAISTRNILDDDIDMTDVVDLERLTAMPPRRHLTRKAPDSPMMSKDEEQFNRMTLHSDGASDLEPEVRQRHPRPISTILPDDGNVEMESDSMAENASEGPSLPAATGRFTMAGSSDDSSDDVPLIRRRSAPGSSSAVLPRPTQPWTPGNSTQSRLISAETTHRKDLIKKEQGSTKKGPVAGHFFPPPPSPSPASRASAATTPANRRSKQYRNESEEYLNYGSPPDRWGVFSRPFVCGMPEPTRLSGTVRNEYTGENVPIRLEQIRVGGRKLDVSQIDWDNKDHVNALNRTKGQKIRWARKDPDRTFNRYSDAEIAFLRNLIRKDPAVVGEDVTDRFNEKFAGIVENGRARGDRSDVAIHAILVLLKRRMAQRQES